MNQEMLIVGGLLIVFGIIFVVGAFLNIRESMKPKKTFHLSDLPATHYLSDNDLITVIKIIDDKDHPKTVSCNITFKELVECIDIKLSTIIQDLGKPIQEVINEKN